MREFYKVGALALVVVAGSLGTGQARASINRTDANTGSQTGFDANILSNTRQT